VAVAGGEGWWRRLGSRTAAPSSSDGALFFQCFPVTLPVWFSSSFQLFLPLPTFWASFLFSSLPSLLSVCFFFCFFFVFSPLGSLFFRVSLLLLFSLLPFPLSPVPFSQRSWVLFIEPRAWLFLMGSSRLVGHWARLPRFGSTRFSGRCVVGQCVRSVGSRRERDRKKFKQKPLFPSSPLQCLGGKKKEEQCRSKRHRSAPLFSLFFF